MKKLILLTIISLFVQRIYSQDNLLQSGPMVGYSTMKEVLLWAQTTEPAEVYFKYWDKTQDGQVYRTDKVLTTKEQFYVARLIADKLEPGVHYEYALYINDKQVNRPYRLQFQSQPIWKWRGDAPDFSFAMGSGTYINEEKYDRPGTPYGGDYRILNDIYQRAPDFMLWLGDNVYLREADWNSRTGIFYRYTHTRSVPEMQAMLGSMHHYAIWDDHDFGPNDSDRSFPMKKTTEEAFKLFFANPNYIFDEGTTGMFQWADCDFFLLDNRYWRTPNKRDDIEKHQILGERQIEWLLDALVNSYAPFKFVVMGGEFLNPAQEYERYAHYAPAERQIIINAIEKLKINGVVFITGDVHYTELSKIDLKEGYPLYDFTISPLTSAANGHKIADNPLQIEGSLITQRNYAQINVFGNREERALKLSVFSTDGALLWEKVIKAADLKFQ